MTRNYRTAIESVYGMELQAGNVRAAIPHSPISPDPFDLSALMSMPKEAT